MLKLGRSFSYAHRQFAKGSNKHVLGAVRCFSSSGKYSTLPRFQNPSEMYENIRAVTDNGACVRNYTGTIVSMARPNLVVETDLFDAESLDFYSRHNLGMLDEEGSDAALYKK